MRILILAQNTSRRFFLGRLSIFLLVFTTSAHAENALNPILVQELKTGYIKSCVPNISQQLASVGLPTKPKAKDYCECLSNFYFNDFTDIDYQYLKKSEGVLPLRIRENQIQIREHCADLHLF